MADPGPVTRCRATPRDRCPAPCSRLGATESPTDRRRRWLPVSALVAIFALSGGILVSCGDDPDEGAGAPDTTPTETVEATVTAEPTSEPTPEPADDPSPSPPVDPTTPPPREGTEPAAGRPTLDDPVTCTNDDAGYSVEYPRSWSTNDGAVVPPCSLFDPEPFDVPEATDERVAAISIFRENIAFSDVPVDEDAEQALTVVAGLQAVRVEGAYDGRGLYPAGTRFTSYRIDLDPGVDDGAGTLIADVVEVGDVDYAQAQRTLDLMVRTLVPEVDDDTEPAAVGVFEGGGTPVTVRASFEDRVCFTSASDAGDDAERTCVDPDGVRAEPLDAPGGMTVGVAPGDVFRVEAQLTDDTLSALPVPVLLGAGAYAWALPVPLEEIDRLRWFDISGRELGAAEPDPNEDSETG